MTSFGSGPVAETPREQHVVVERPELESLDKVAHHTAIPELTRWVFPRIPMLTAVHQVVGATASEREYCQPHSHSDHGEVLVILGEGEEFLVDLVVGTKSYRLGPLASVYIPSKTTHAANVASGTGFIVVLYSSADTRRIT